MREGGGGGLGRDPNRHQTELAKPCYWSQSNIPCPTSYTNQMITRATALFPYYWPHTIGLAVSGCVWEGEGRQGGGTRPH